MPIDDKNRVVCVNHKDSVMQKQRSYGFLGEAEKQRKGNVNILMGRGIPLVVYVCKLCGYVETYAATAAGDWYAKRLYIQCKNDKCKREFLSPIQMNEKSFKSSKLEHNSYQCYYCEQMGVYSKDDHFFK